MKLYELQYAKIDWKVCYQEVSEDGTQNLGYRDENGKKITLPEGVEVRVTDTNPFPTEEKLPKWAKPVMEEAPEVASISGKKVRTVKRK